MSDSRFTQVGIRPLPPPLAPAPRRRRPCLSAFLLGAILLGCLLCDLFIPKDPAYMDLANCSRPPSAAFLFGTDTMGRDIFSMIWSGGRVSLFIAFLATAISTAIAVIFGSLSALAPPWLDALLMRLTEILLSVPSLLLIVLLQAVLGQPNAVTIAIVIGVTSWTSIAKVVRTEVRQIRSSEFVIASRCMGGGFFHILWRHLAPNFLPSILFMVVMDLRSAIVAESTLSFMGIGLPLSVISWGSMLSLSEKALLANAWWIILIPGLFLIVTLLCITDLGNRFRKNANRKESNL